MYISSLKKPGGSGSITPAAQRAAAGKWSLSRCHMLTPLPNSYWRTPKGWKNGADFPLLYICSTNAAKLRLRRWDTPSGATFYWGMIHIQYTYILYKIHTGWPIKIVLNFQFFLIFSWVWGISPIFFVLTYWIDLPKTCSRPLANLWYLAPETPERPVKIFHSFMDFHQYLFFPEIFRGARAPQHRGILSCF